MLCITKPPTPLPPVDPQNKSLPHRKHLDKQCNNQTDLHNKTITSNAEKFWAQNLSNSIKWLPLRRGWFVVTHKAHWRNKFLKRCVCAYKVPWSSTLNTAHTHTQDTKILLSSYGAIRPLSEITRLQNLYVTAIKVSGWVRKAPYTHTHIERITHRNTPLTGVEGMKVPKVKWTCRKKPPVINLSFPSISFHLALLCSSRRFLCESRVVGNKCYVDEQNIELFFFFCRIYEDTGKWLWMSTEIFRERVWHIEDFRL